MKISTAVGLLAVLTVIGWVWFLIGGTGVTPQETIDYKNATYTIGGRSVTLVNGHAEYVIAPDSESKEKIAVFGKPVYGDLDGDGDNDAVLLLTQDSGGSGTFYYAVVAVNDNGTYKGTNAMLLGDRIAPQTVEIHDGRAVVNFAERAAGENFAVQPHIGKSVWINLDVTNMEIGEAVQDFEGESDVSRLIQVSYPLPNQKITSPLKVSGKARGNWYFEASFPVFLTDWDGKIIAQGIATARGDWMTTEFVPFTAELSFDKADISGQYSDRGTLILKKDNPSGLPQYDDALEITVSF